MGSKARQDLQVPYQLVTTNLPGAFTSPPDENFDPSLESSASRKAHGLLWRRPTAEDDQAVHAAWDRAFSRPWDPAKRITPQLEPQIGKTHHLRGLRRVSDSNFTSNNWSGAVLFGSWIGVIGFWHIPTVTKSAEPQGTEGGWSSASWIGIDGVSGSSNDVLQAGVNQNVDSNGNASYVAWYEWYAPPKPSSPPYIYQTNIPNFRVAPGDYVLCSVQYVGDTAGQIYFANDRTGEHFSITLKPPPGASFNGSSAEWIMEAPDGGEPTSSLPNFTPLHFTDAICCGPDNEVGNPVNGDTVNILGLGRTQTSVTIGSFDVTINSLPSIGLPTGTEMLCFVANNDTNDLLLSLSTGGVDWSGTAKVNQSSKTTPALARFNGSLVMAFVANNDSNDLLVCSSSDGLSWSPNTKVNQSSQTAPALAVLNGSLVMAFVANNDTNDLLVCSSSDGLTWSPDTKVNQSSKAAPALAVFGAGLVVLGGNVPYGPLFMAFVANNDSNDLLVCSSPDGVNFTPNTKVNQSSTAAPALAVCGLPALFDLPLSLLIAFVANNDTNDLLVSSSPDGVTWSVNTKVNQSSQAAPAVLNFPLNSG